MNFKCPVIRLIESWQLQQYRLRTALLSEDLAFLKQGVAGSNPVTSTIFHDCPTMDFCASVVVSSNLPTNSAA
jgi:hypothetical protein